MRPRRIASSPRCWRARGLDLIHTLAVCEAMDVSLFDFELPEERIALRPASARDSARMLVVHRDGQLEHSRVRDLPNYLGCGDALVVNDTKVIPARLHGRRLPRE